LAKINAFQKFVTEAAISRGAVTIGEEMSEDRMLDYGHNAMSVAQLVAQHLKIAHVFCEPNRMSGTDWVCGPGTRWCNMRLK
jgi:hypothetical protein